jgi:hypothetical protein
MMVRNSHQPAGKMNTVLFLDSVLRVPTAACVTVRLVQRHYCSTHTRHSLLTPQHDYVHSQRPNIRIHGNRNYDTWKSNLLVHGSGSESHSSSGKRLWSTKQRCSSQSSVFLCFILPRISKYACNESNLMHSLSSVYWATAALHASGLLVVHHQEVAMYICDSWYVLYVSIDCRWTWIKFNGTRSVRVLFLLLYHSHSISGTLFYASSTGLFVL